MKRTITLFLIITAILCLTVSGCALSDAVVGDSPRSVPNIDIEKRLADDRNEFLEIPWFSPVSTAFETLEIARDDIIILRLDDLVFEFAVPVFLVVIL